MVVPVPSAQCPAPTSKYFCLQHTRAGAMPCGQESYWRKGDRILMCNLQALRLWVWGAEGMGEKAGRKAHKVTNTGKRPLSGPSPPLAPLAPHYASAPHAVASMLRLYPHTHSVFCHLMRIRVLARCGVCLKRRRDAPDWANSGQTVVPLEPKLRYRRVA